MKWFQLKRSSVAVFIFFFISAVSAQSEGDRKVVVIDPGHGGSDSGAVGIYGIKEKDVVLKLAQKILQLNEKDGKFEIYLTRYSDTLISLKDRTILAKALQADLYISLHCNHANSPFAKGLEIFVAAGEISESKKNAIFLAYELHRKITTATGIVRRGVKFADFQVLMETINFAPSVLIELCFLSNKDETEFLIQAGVIQTMALVILESI